MGSPTGFHRGELAVQDRAGLTRQASRLAGMLATPNLDGGMAGFVAERDLVVVTSRDHDGILWTSPLYGQPGFSRAYGTTLSVSGLPLPGDPLHGLRSGEQAGVLLIDFHRRRRLRINGTLTSVDADGFEVTADQAFGNCPQYIRRRHLEVGARPDAAGTVVSRDEHLRSDDTALIARADTFVLGTAHPTRGADSSHRGGAPGFVRVEQGELWWPDYPGNNLFNSLGNIVEDPAAALLFLDVETSSSLQLSGRARLEWTRRGVPGDDAGTGRRVRFTPERIVRTTGLPLRLVGDVQPARTPPLT